MVDGVVDHLSCNGCGAGAGGGEGAGDGEPKGEDGRERGAAAEAAFLRASRNMAAGEAKLFFPAKTCRPTRRRAESRPLWEGLRKDK